MRKINLAGKVLGICAILAGRPLIEYGLLRAIVEGQLLRTEFAALIEEHNVFALLAIAREKRNVTLDGILAVYSCDTECGQKILN